jgi:hypothetical protein
MLNQIFNENNERGDYFCTIVCTDPAQLSPNTMISPTERDSILLKIHGTQNVIRTSNQRVGSSNLSGRATFPLIMIGLKAILMNGGLGFTVVLPPIHSHARDCFE